MALAQSSMYNSVGKVTILAALAAAASLAVRAAVFEIDATSGEAAVPSSLAVGDTIRLSLAGGVAFSLDLVAAPPPGIAGPSFIAHDAHSQAAAVVKPLADGLRVTVDDFEHGRIHSVRIRNGKVETSVRETSVGDGDDVCGTCGGDLAVPSGSGAPAPRAQRVNAPTRSADAFPIAEHKAVIDILVAFDEGAKAWAEGASWADGDTIEEFADYAVQKMNYVLEKSQLLDTFCYRLVGVVEVDATYSTINGTLLEALRLRNSGTLAPLAAARERCGADAITLLIDRTEGNTSGLGYEFLKQWTHESFDSNGYTCNICDIKTVYSRYTMSHECGHNLGCGHSDRQGTSSGPGYHPYSCGYHFTDAAGTNRYTIMGYSYTSPASGEYLHVPYFSSPDIVPPEYGVAVGTPTNDNRRTAIANCQGASRWREHAVPYEWDVSFVDSGGNEIPDGSYFFDTLYVTLTNSDPNAVIYYTYDGSVPGPGSFSCANGQRFTFYETRTLTACAVVDGVAQSVCTRTFNCAQTWSGEAGMDGGGAWTTNASAFAWDDSSHAYDEFTPVAFQDVAGVAIVTVAVHGAVSPPRSDFIATATAYVFTKGTPDATIHLRDACLVPAGDIAFNVPVLIDAVAFTNPANHTVAFNAPFGQTVTATTGHCTNMVGIGKNGTLVVSPGAGNTQYFDTLNNKWYYSSARFRVGEGTVVFNGPGDASTGVFGNTGIVVDGNGTLVFDMAGRIAGTYSSISGEGMVVCKTTATAGSMAWNGSAWRGTLAFEGLVADDSTKDFDFTLYGNTSSKILLRNCAIMYLKKDNASLAGTLVLEGEGALRLGGDGYSYNWNSFVALEGDGSISASSKHSQTYVFNTATNYTGSMEIGASNGTGRRIVFGTVSSSSDLPAQSATITVKPGATASIGGGATWSAYNGVEIAGTLLVKGAAATLDCNATASVGLCLDDGATLRFEAADASLVFAKAPAFASGTVNIAFAPGVSPCDRWTLATWPEGGMPAGGFAFKDAAVSLAWELVKTATGLVARVKNRFDVPGMDASIVYGDALADWLDDQNFWMYEGTWQEFMAERGGNGYLNWQSYILGLSTDPTATIRAKIGFDAQGNAVVSVADSIPNAPAVPGFSISCMLLSTASLDDWPTGGTDMHGKSVVLPVNGNVRFYRVVVVIEAGASGP